MFVVTKQQAKEQSNTHLTPQKTSMESRKISSPGSSRDLTKETQLGWRFYKDIKNLQRTRFRGDPLYSYFIYAHHTAARIGRNPAF